MTTKICVHGDAFVDALKAGHPPPTLDALKA